MAGLKTRPIHNRAELVAHFDESAASYAEAHGDAGRLLAYRLALIRRFCRGRSGILLELGCGPATHLIALAPDFTRLIGVDISPAMIEAARRAAAASPEASRIQLRVDPAEELSTVDDASVDVALCVGALEHMHDRQMVLRHVARVLKPGGLFVLLTPNGGYFWYTMLAPALGIPTRHLSTDRFLKRSEAIGLIRDAGLTVAEQDCWTFIPKGDMSGWASQILQAFDWIGRLFRLRSLRGGLVLAALKND